MKTIDVYERYFEGECEYNGRPRRARYNRIGKTKKAAAVCR